jgi:FkbH-like protein
MSALYSELQWLPPAPEDYSARLKQLSNAENDLGAEVQALATHALDLNQLTRLARVITNARLEDRSLEPLASLRLAVLSNSTIDFIVPALVASAARHGILLDVIQPSYDQAAQEALTPDSMVNSSKPDAVLFALDYRAIPFSLSLGDLAGSEHAVKSAMTYFQTLHNGIKSHSSAACIFQTLARPVESLFGSLDRAVHGTMRSFIDRVNQELADHVLSSGDVLIDIAGLAETVGLANWHNMQLWNMGKFSFSDEFIPLYADHVARSIAALRGGSKKVLVLDLDNTVWGGVIGDDGLEGIKVAKGDACGEAHLAVQRLALDLRSRGIALAVSSKNTDAIAREPFLKHPEMLLKLEHIAVFRANWNDKASNLRAIADELSLGLDSLVFLDDNPAERWLVRKLLPRVAVPELPEDPAYFARTLAAAGYFESVAFVEEDLKRSGFYQDNAKRANLEKQIDNLDTYLESLKMTITFQPFNSTGRARIVQLINKSNQFNLTARRYTDPEVAQIENNPEVFTLQVRLADIFGDNGMISVVICRPGDIGVWEIDTWLMSCRVLGRKVEQMVLREMLEHARASNIHKLVGVYIPTNRNQLVVDHYAKLGFTKQCEGESGLTRWELYTDEVNPQCAPMKVVSESLMTAKKESLA